MKEKSTKLAKELSKRFKKEFNIDAIPIIYRTYVGYWQKTAGGWLWFMFEPDSRSVGSVWRAKDVLKAKKLSLWSGTGQHEILVEEE